MRQAVLIALGKVGESVQQAAVRIRGRRGRPPLRHGTRGRRDGASPRPAASPRPTGAAALCPALAERAGVIEIELVDGTRLRVDAFVNERALRRVLAAVKAAGA